MKKIYAIIAVIIFIFPLFFAKTPDAEAAVLCTVKTETNISSLKILIGTSLITHILPGNISASVGEVTAPIQTAGGTTDSDLAKQMVAGNAQKICEFVRGGGGALSGIKEGCTLTRGIKLPDGTSFGSGDFIGPLQTEKWGVVCLINTVNVLTDWAFFILLTLAFVFIAVAGFIWMTAGSDPEKQGTAGKIIAAALIGIVIAILARVIPAVITGILL